MSVGSESNRRTLIAAPPARSLRAIRWAAHGQEAPRAWCWMTGDARLTEERLRTWLDGNQPARERLCVHLLALNRRFSHVAPRQPKGGPDDGYDIEATIAESGGRAVGAVGFRNSPTDSAADVRWARSKFTHDLQNAKACAGEFHLFVFFTNIRLTVGVRQKLLVLGKELSDVEIEIVDREQMRVTLDGPEGLAARYQFLQIPLSEGEQAAFFARWGADLTSLVATNFAAVKEHLDRLEFLQERQRPLTSLMCVIRLTEATTFAALPHVRAFLSIAKMTRNTERSLWNIGVCSNAPLRHAPNCGAGPCLAGAFWLSDPSTPNQTSASAWEEPFSRIVANGGFTEFTDPKVVATLDDIDDSYFALFMNQRLFERIATVDLYANQYLIWSAKANTLSADSPNAEPKTPWEFSAEELSDAWVRVMPRRFTGSLDFSSETPRRMWEPRRLEPAS